MSAGYRRVNGNALEHRVVAERALGKPLPEGAVVHHVNENKRDNRPENLVICESKAYHSLLHVRMTARATCGNPNYRKCAYCGKYDDPSAMDAANHGHQHRECRYRYTNGLKRKRHAQVGPYPSERNRKLRCSKCRDNHRCSLLTGHDGPHRAGREGWTWQ